MVDSRLLRIAAGCGVAGFLLVGCSGTPAPGSTPRAASAAAAQPGTAQPGTASQPGNAAQPGTPAQPGTAQPGTAQPGTAQPGTTQPGDQGRRHGGRPGNQNAVAPGGDAATWPAGVPLPAGRVLGVTTSPGEWMVSEIVDLGFDEATASATRLYQAAGYRLRSSSPGGAVLVGPTYAVTISVASNDHRVAQSQVVALLSRV